MLRIIAGRLKSRLLKMPQYHQAHPMSDRGRMALFNILGDLTDTELVLDAYAGSGSLAFEALSRGAQRAVIIEINRRIYPQLVENVRLLGLKERVQVYRANNTTCLANLNLEFDLIFLDPPYPEIKAENLLKISRFLKKDGRLVLSYPPHFAPPFEPPAWQCLHSKTYAHLNLAVYAMK